MIDQYVFILHDRSVFDTIGIEILVIHYIQELILNVSMHFGKCTNI